MSGHLDDAIDEIDARERWDEPTRAEAERDDAPDPPPCGGAGELYEAVGHGEQADVLTWPCPGCEDCA